MYEALKVYLSTYPECHLVLPERGKNHRITVNDHRQWHNVRRQYNDDNWCFVVGFLGFGPHILTMRQGHDFSIWFRMFSLHSSEIYCEREWYYKRHWKYRENTEITISTYILMNKLNLESWPLQTLRHNILIFLRQRVTQSIKYSNLASVNCGQLVYRLSSWIKYWDMIMLIYKCLTARLYFCPSVCPYIYLYRIAGLSSCPVSVPCVQLYVV